MTTEQQGKCHAIIHVAAAAAGTANLSVINSVGIAGDLVAMTTMTLGLAAVFGGSIKYDDAKDIIIGELKKVIPQKGSVKLLSKFVPGVKAAVSVGTVEKIGWELSKRFEKEYAK